MCAGDRRENKVKALVNNSIWVTRNGSRVVVQQSSNGFRGTVIRSVERTYPVGAVIAYKSDMGHVLCEGSDDHSCELHPMDAEEYRDRTNYAAELITQSLQDAKDTRARLVAAL